MSQQQAERQKKSLLQTCMMFHHRAAKIAQEPPKLYVKNCPTNIGVDSGKGSTPSNTRSVSKPSYEEFIRTWFTDVYW